MKTLKDYTTYLREKRLREVALYNLKVVKGMDIPLLKLLLEKGFIKGLDDETTIKMTMDSLNKSLLSIEKGTAYDDFKTGLKQWEEDKMPGISKNEIVPADLILVHAAQRKTYQQFIPDYTSDAKEAMGIIAELEEFQTRVQNEAMQLIFDIQRKTEENRQRLIEMMEATPDFVGFAEAKDRRIQFINAAGRKMCGLENNEDVTRLKIDDVHPEWMNKMFKEEIFQVAVRDGIWKGEAAFLNIKTKKETPVLMVLLAHKNAAGEVTRFSTISRDITEQKLVEEELRAVNNFLDSVLENIPNMVFVKDAQDLRFVRFNKAGENLLGYSKKELLGKSDYDFFPKEQAEFFIRNDQVVLSQNDIVNIPEEPIDTKSGQKWLHTKKIPIRSPAGRPMYLLGISEDITEIRKAKLELEQKTKELERSNAELEQFAYVASHDLQEPLRTVSSYVQLLASRYKDKLDKDANEFIDFAVDGSKRMRQLINSLLEYSRVNRVKPFEWMELTDIMNEVKQDIKDQITESHAVIKYDGLPKIYGDVVLIGQLFQNLVGNAIKFHGDKKPEIKISGKRKNGQYVFSVEDNGIGIPPEYSEKIFIIFQRLNNREKYPGTGIGLSICKKIVEKHGGKIWVESKPGKGSAFYFTINAS